MKARAPGKLVVSGAYAVLRGAPALVTAVDRYVVADDGESSQFETPEVDAALKLMGQSGPHPAFYADALREDDRKLGLGSSAAICAASVALIKQKDLPPDQLPTDQELANAIYDLTLQAHRTAQGGGSGIDVAAACFGGTLGARLNHGDGSSQLELTPVELPSGIVIETWASPQAAKTSEFVKRVFNLEVHNARDFARLMQAQHDASEDALLAAQNGTVRQFVSALRHQFEALSALGRAAQVPIVLDDIERLAEQLETEQCLIPSGAGGGDVTLYVSDRPSSDTFREKARAMRLKLVPLGLGARGVHLIND